MQRCHKSASFGSLILHQLTKRVFILNLFGTLCHTAHFSPSNKTAAIKNSLFSLWCLIYKTPIGLPNFHSITLYSAQGEDQHLAHAAMTHKVHHVHAPATLRKIAPEYIWSFSVRARCKRGGCILALLFLYQLCTRYTCLFQKTHTRFATFVVTTFAPFIKTPFIRSNFYIDAGRQCVGIYYI